MLFCHFLYTFSEKKMQQNLDLLESGGLVYDCGTVFSTSLYILPLYDETSCVCWEEGALVRANLAYYLAWCWQTSHGVEPGFYSSVLRT